MTIIFGLLVLLAATRMFAEGAVRLRLPASVGEILAGAALAGGIVLVGDRVPLLGEIAASEQLALVAQAGIFFLVLQAGIDMKPTEIAQQSARSLAIALGGALVPLSLGIALGWVLLPDNPLRPVQAFFIGVALSITAIPATVKVLEEQGLLHKPFGQAIVAAALFDDIFGLFLLAVLTGLLQSEAALSFFDTLRLLGQIVVFFAVTVTLGAHVYPRIVTRLQWLQLASAEFSILMLVALGYALFADLMGLHWIIGAFVAGLYFEPSRVGARAYSEIRLIVTGITAGFLGPLFFASIGLNVRYETVIETPLLLAALVAAGIAGKFVGAGGVAAMVGFARREAAAIGAGMSARGAVELIVISIAAEYGLFCGSGCGAGDNVISALILMAVITTLLAPMMLRAIVRGL